MTAKCFGGPAWTTGETARILGDLFFWFRTFSIGSRRIIRDDAASHVDWQRSSGVRDISEKLLGQLRPASAQFLPNFRDISAQLLNEFSDF
jgi:hypothetical protein